MYGARSNNKTKVSKITSSYNVSYVQLQCFTNWLLITKKILIEIPSMFWKMNQTNSWQKKNP